MWMESNESQCNIQSTASWKQLVMKYSYNFLESGFVYFLYYGFIIYKYPDAFISFCGIPLWYTISAQYVSFNYLCERKCVHLALE